jgi:plastocyanin
MRFPLPLLVSVTALAALGAPVASAAPDAGQSAAVPILVSSFASPRIDVLAGDTVTWHNDSIRAHTVTAGDGSWTSTPLAGSGTFTHQFADQGAVTYYCRLHPFMRGEVDVHRLLLTPPRDAAAPGRPYLLTGRAALPPGSPVSIQADGTVAATTTVNADGSFRATVEPTTTTSVRAIAGDQASAPVQLLVLDRSVVARAGREARRVVVDARVRPASPGATVVLQLRLREHFGWWPVQRVRLDRDSHARFRLALSHPTRARVVLTASDGATPLADSTILRLRPHR